MRWLVSFVVLARCAAGAGAPGMPHPQAARLSQERLTLTLSDGTICRADWRAAPVGRMENCGPGYGYAVREFDNPNPLRRVWTGLTTALGAEGAVPPLAEVVITDPAGIDTTFASPAPVPE